VPLKIILTANQIKLLVRGIDVQRRKRKSPLSSATLLFDAPLQGTPIRITIQTLHRQIQQSLSYILRRIWSVIVY